MGIRVIAWGDVNAFPGAVCTHNHRSRVDYTLCGMKMRSALRRKQRYNTDSSGYLVVDMLGQKWPELARHRASVAVQKGDFTAALQEMARAVILEYDAIHSDA